MNKDIKSVILVIVSDLILSGILAAAVFAPRKRQRVTIGFGLQVERSPAASFLSVQ